MLLIDEEQFQHVPVQARPPPIVEPHDLWFEASERPNRVVSAHRTLPLR
jgi:hypothetical protein